MSGAVVAAACMSVPDSTPDAVDWGNISFAHGGSGNNSDQTVTGINQTMSFYWASDTFVLAGGVMKYSKDGGAYTTLDQVTAATVNNNQTLNWQASNLAVAGGPYTIQVFYGTVGLGVLWDTFTVTAT